MTDFVTRDEMKTAQAVSELKGESKWVRVVGIALLVSSFTVIIQLAGLKGDIISLQLGQEALRADVTALQVGQQQIFEILRDAKLMPGN